MVKTPPRPNNVRTIRRAVGLTQAGLAEACGVSRQTVISIEGGDYSPSVFLALDIASALDTSVEALFSPVAETQEPRHA